MARQVLPVNFQDDVLNASMNGKRRYMLLQQDDGSYILNDVTNYDTEGSTFGAAQINATNQAVNQSVDKDDVLNTSEEVEANVDEKKVTGALVTKQLISEFQDWFGVTEDGQRGWKEQGADTVYPFFKTVEITGVASLEKVGAPNDDRAYARIEAPDGFEISQIIYSSSGFSTGMYYNFNVGGTTIGDQERSNVTNRELDISSAQDRSFLQVLIRQYNESSSGTGSVSYTIQFKRKAG